MILRGLKKKKNCHHWHNRYPDVKDDDAYGSCDVYEWGCYGSDHQCENFKEK